MLSRHSNQKDPLIYLQGITFDIADKLIEFMYKGEVNVSEKVLATFMDIAEDLKIKGLKSKKDKAAINRFIKNDSKEQSELQLLQRYGVGLLGCKVYGREGRTDDIRRHIRRNHQANMSEEAANPVKL